MRPINSIWNTPSNPTTLGGKSTKNDEVLYNEKTENGVEKKGGMDKNHKP